MKINIQLLITMAVAARATASDSLFGSMLRNPSTTYGDTYADNVVEATEQAMLSTLQDEMQVSENASQAHSVKRQLQSSRLWDISPPAISYEGMQLDMEHTVRDQVRTDNVRINLFRNEDCTMEIDDASNNYISVDVVNDLTAFGDGAGTRQMTVNLNINPQTITNSRIITFTSEDPIISFCVRFNLIDSATNEVANSLDTPVAVRVDITDRLEILALLEDEEENYGAEAFECDEDNNRITEPVLKTQGARIRVCVQPNSFTQGFGVVMRSINRFQMIRGDVSQDVIVPDGVIKDLLQTEYRCTPGEVVCYLETEVSNRFFYSRGTVSATGVAWLQYASANGDRRGMVEVPFRVGGGTKGEATFDDNAPVVLLSPLWNRQMVEAGGFIGSRDVSMSFEVEPSGTDWGATAFLCNGQNRPLEGTALTRPRNKDDDIRVCFMPNDDAREKGVYVREVSSFFFEQVAEERVQFAIEPSKKPASGTIFICNAGEPLCALKTELSLDFFDKNLNVVGKGEVLLQYGTQPRLPSQEARRHLQDATDPTVDAGFAGRADVTIEFRTDPTYVPPAEKTWQEKAEEWWLGTPLFLRIVYVLAAVIGFLILLCFMWAICCGNPFASKSKQPDGPIRKRRLFVQPVFVRNKNGGDQDEDHEGGDEPKASRQTQDTSSTQDPPQDAPTIISHRLENGPMDAVPEAESAHFNSPKSKRGNQSFPMIEPDYTKSPNTPSRRDFTGEVNNTKSPKRHSSAKRQSSSKSPKSRRPKSTVDGDRAATPKSAKRKTTSVVEDTLSSNHSARSSKSQSPKPRRSKRAAPIQSPGLASSDSTSPLPRRSSTGSSPRRSTRSMSSTKSPVSGKPAKRRTGTMDDSARSTESSRRTPRKRRSSADGSKTKRKIPDVPAL